MCDDNTASDYTDYSQARPRRMRPISTVRTVNRPKVKVEVLATYQLFSDLLPETWFEQTFDGDWTTTRHGNVVQITKPKLKHVGTGHPFGLAHLTFTVEMELPTGDFSEIKNLATASLNELVDDSDVQVLWAEPI